MIYNNINPVSLLILTLCIGALNLIAPFVSNGDNPVRNFLLITISVIFFANILLLDYLFLHGIQASYVISVMGKYVIAFHLEALGMIFLTLLSALWICALCYSIKFLAVNNIINSNRFLFFVNACIFVGVIVAVSANLFTMFLAYEILTLCTIPLIIHQYTQSAVQQLSLYLKLLMLTALILFLPAIIIIYHKIGHGNFTVNGIIDGQFSDMFGIALLLMFVFGISKSAIYPLHFWLPAAMVASYPVSALLHAVVVVKVGLFCMYKILIYIFGLIYLNHLFINNNWLILFPIVSIIYTALQSLRYTQIKMILAYSTINQLNIALLSAFILSAKGISAAIFHMIAHSLTKICLFYSAGNIYSVKNSYHISELAGMKDIMPKTSAIMFIAGLSLIGIPPFAGFISKFCILQAAAEKDNVLILVTLIASSLFSSIYMIKILTYIYTNTTKDMILKSKFKSYFTQDITSDSTDRQIINAKYRAERKLPSFMINAVAICLSGVVFFIPIHHILKRFLLFMTL